MEADEYRVEVELDDDEHGYSLGERLRSLDLDDEARRALGGSVVVTRDGSKLYLYATREPEAREAERVVRELLASDGLTGEIAVTRWHEIEQEWKDASLPLPRTDKEVRAEYERREAAEAREAHDEGAYGWRVVAHVGEREAAVSLARRLEQAGVPVTRRWRYVFAAELTEERASELADRIRADVPEGTDVWVEPNPSDLPLPTLLFLPA